MFFRPIYHDTGRPNQEQYLCFIQRAKLKSIVHVLSAIMAHCDRYKEEVLTGKSSIASLTVTQREAVVLYKVNDCKMSPLNVIRQYF